jgi:hypothetical protein
VVFPNYSPFKQGQLLIIGTDGEENGFGQLKEVDQPGVAVHAWNSSTREVEAGKLISSTAWVT